MSIFNDVEKQMVDMCFQVADVYLSRLLSSGAKNAVFSKAFVGENTIDKDVFNTLCSLRSVYNCIQNAVYVWQVSNSENNQ